MDFTGTDGSIILAIIVSVASAIFGALAVDIYARVKAGSKKIMKKAKQEKDQELRQTITETLTAAFEPIREDIAIVKRDLNEIVTEDLPQLKRATRDSLRNQLLAVYRHCEKYGGRTLEDTENFEYMFKSYEALGGNSFITTVRDSFLNLPMR